MKNRKPVVRYTLVFNDIPESRGSLTAWQCLDLYKTGEAVIVHDQQSEFLYRILNYKIVGDRLHVWRTIDYAYSRNIIEKVKDGPEKRYQIDYKAGETVYASILKIDKDILAYECEDTERSGGEGVGLDRVFKNALFLKTKTIDTSEKYIRAAAHEVRKELWDKNTITTVTYLKIDPMSKLSNKIRAERQARERTVKGADFVIDMGISLHCFDPKTLGLVIGNTTQVFECLLNDGYHNNRDYSAPVSNPVLNRVTFTSIKYGGKLLCMDEHVWSRGQINRQYKLYEQNDGKIIVYGVCATYITPMTEAYGVSDTMLKQLGHTFYGKRKAKDGEYLKPVSPGGPWTRVAKRWSLIKDPSITPPPCRDRELSRKK